jgi:hypothetical protein
MTSPHEKARRFSFVASVSAEPEFAEQSEDILQGLHDQTLDEETHGCSDPLGSVVDDVDSGSGALPPSHGNNRNPIVPVEPL